MSPVQLSFSLRVSSTVKTVHLLGSWDNYVGQLPLSKDAKSTKGSWKGTFRFQGETLVTGQRYWYYYIVDGYHITHNPEEKSTTEPTTGRELNVLDVGKSKSSSSSKHSSSSSSSKHSSSHSSHSSSHSKSSKSSSSSSSSKSSSHSSHSARAAKEKMRHSTIDVAKGRPVSVSEIKSPKPRAPHATRHILTADYDVDELNDYLARTSIGEDGEYEGVIDIVYGDDTYAEDAEITADMGVVSGSPVSLGGSDLSYSSDDASSQGAFSSVSGYSTPSSDYSSCTCERYGITRKGDRVRIDCGGTRCGYEESCSSSDEEYERQSSRQSSRRNGIVMAA